VRTSSYLENLRQQFQGYSAPRFSTVVPVAKRLKGSENGAR